MILFLVSFLLVFASAFLFASIFEKKKFIPFFLYVILFAFANVVLTFEVLSLFSAINRMGVLCLNLIVFAAAVALRVKNGFLLDFNFRGFFKRLFAAFKSDKYLSVLTFSVLFMLIVSLWLISFMPVVNPDAEAYHVLRSVLWVFDKKISHVPIADVRNVVLPINSEILYAWIILFVKKQVWFGIFSFIGYVMSAVSLWGLMCQIGVGFKRRLWAVCLMSSFASVIVQISSTETDIIIAGLITASMYLFMKGVRENNSGIPIAFSALSYALAVGTKTPAIMMIPAAAMWMLAISVFHCKKKFYIPVVKFCIWFIVMFSVFSAYNYVLNFIDFRNIAGSKSFMIVHKNLGGFRASCANFIKYLFMFFDFTGFALNNTLGNFILQIRDNLLTVLGLQNIADGFHSSSSSNANSYLLEPLMGMGLLGFLVYLPCWLIAFIKPCFSRRKTDLYIMSFAVVLLAALVTMSWQIVFMTYSIRFFTSFCVIAAPVLALSYFKKNNIFKFLIVFIALFYLLMLSTHLWARPAMIISRYFRHGAGISEVREIAICAHFNNEISKYPEPLKHSPLVNPMCIVRNEIKNFDKRNKILYFSNASDGLLLIKLMNFQGYNIDFNIIENMENIDFSKYNLILVSNDAQISSNVRNFDKISAISGKYYKDGAACRYLNTKEQLVTAESNDYPYLSSCTLEPYFYKKHHFKFNRLFTIQSKVDGENFTIDYKFYENEDNPQIR